MKRVDKVLVDGEEFFGNDPGIANQNISADAVKEVQVFDKKSDQAEFTGIDDGVKDKTINLKMKQKERIFGQVELGGGFGKDKCNNAIMLSSFDSKRKYGSLWQYEKYLFMEQGLILTGGQHRIREDRKSWVLKTMLNMMNERLCTSALVAWDENFYEWCKRGSSKLARRLHYSDNWNEDRNKFNFRYRYNKVNVQQKIMVLLLHKISTNRSYY